MKKVFQNWILALAAMLITTFAVEAQYDDVYYDPDTDDTYYQSSNDRNTSYQDEYAYYDDDEYSYYDDYDYHYTSRIRRFRRPYVGFGFYDPCYVDSYYYDPFYSSAWFPGNTIYFGFGGNDYWSFRRYRRWARWNRYNFGFNPISAYYAYNYCPPGWGFGWNNWNRPFFNSWNNYSYGYFNSIYFNSCPSPIINTYGVNNGWANSGETRPNGVVYGPRRTGTVTSSPRGVIKSGSQAQPVFKGNNPNRSTRDGDFLKDTPTSIRNNPAGNITKGGDTRTGTISKEVERATRPDRVSKRPVYKPNVDKGNYTAKDQGQTDRVTRGNATRPSSDTYRPTRGNTGNQPSTYKPSSPDRSIRTDASRRIYTPKRDRSTTPRSTNPSSSYRPDKGTSSSKGYTPSTRRSTTPSRSYTPDRSSRRSYSPDRGSSSRSSRSYSPSRSSSPSRSYTPSRSSSSSRSSASPSRSSSRSSASPSRSSSSSSRSSGSRSSGSSRRGNN